MLHRGLAFAALAALGWQLVASCAQHVRVLRRPFATATAFGASEEDRIRAALGDHHATLEALRRHVPEDGYVLCATPRSESRTWLTSALRQLLFPRVQLDVDPGLIAPAAERLGPAAVLFCDFDDGAPGVATPRWRLAHDGARFRIWRYVRGGR